MTLSFVVMTHYNLLFVKHTMLITQNHLSYLQSVRDLRKLGNCRLFVNEFLLIQIPKFGSIEANSEVGSKHPLMTLMDKIRKPLLSFVIHEDPLGCKGQESFIVGLQGILFLWQIQTIHTFKEIDVYRTNLGNNSQKKKKKTHERFLGFLLSEFKRFSHSWLQSNSTAFFHSLNYSPLFPALFHLIGESYSTDVHKVSHSLGRKKG